MISSDFSTFCFMELIDLCSERLIVYKYLFAPTNPLWVALKIQCLLPLKSFNFRKKLISYEEILLAQSKIDLLL